MLRPDLERPWVWTNDTWKPDQPGTFAVIIGVSEYSFLDGSPLHFGLGSLFVSALTARRFFEWLVSTYRWTECSVAKCWLLLAPTPEELAVVPNLAQNAILPTFAACEEAINEWRTEMSNLTPAVAKRSRSFFFFSGHGLEVLPERQVLLPMDYRSPKTPSLNRAVSTQNVAFGLRAASVNVPLHFVVVDACRNDHNNLGYNKPLEGAAILDEPSIRGVNPDAFVPILYASAAGTQAFQDGDPALGPSYFGEALLEGLAAKGLKPDCSSGVCLVDLVRLRPFIERRIVEIVQRRHGRVLNQRARVCGDQTEEGVTEVPTPLDRQPAKETGPLMVAEILPIGMPPSERLRPTPANARRAHDFFGSERITEMWLRGSQVFDYQEQQWLPNGQDIEIVGMQRSENATEFQFDLTIPNAKADRSYWFEFRDEVQVVGCVLPIDQDARTRFRFDMEFATEPRAVTRLDVSVSPENEGDLGLAARLWLASSEFSSRDAVSMRSAMIPRRAELQRRSFPLVALITASVLLKYRLWDDAQSWLTDVPQFVPDAAVIRSELALRVGASDWAYKHALENFLSLDGRPLPSMAETAGYALQQAKTFRADAALSVEEHATIQRLYARLVSCLGLFRAGGLFASFAGPAERITPALLSEDAWPDVEVGEAKQADSRSNEKSAGAGA
jgi:hypothetical protein